MTEILSVHTTPDTPAYVCVRPMDVGRDYLRYKRCKQLVGSWDGDLDNFNNVERLLREQPSTILMADYYDPTAQKLVKNVGTVKAAFRGEWPLIGGLCVPEEYRRDEQGDSRYIGSCLEWDMAYRLFAAGHAFVEVLADLTIQPEQFPETASGRFHERLGFKAGYVAVGMSKPNNLGNNHGGLWMPSPLFDAEAHHPVDRRRIAAFLHIKGELRYNASRRALVRYVPAHEFDMALRAHPDPRFRASAFAEPTDQMVNMAPPHSTTFIDDFYAGQAYEKVWAHPDHRFGDTREPDSIPLSILSLLTVKSERFPYLRNYFGHHVAIDNETKELMPFRLTRNTAIVDDKDALPAKLTMLDPASREAQHVLDELVLGAMALDFSMGNEVHHLPHYYVGDPTLPGKEFTLKPPELPRKTL